MKLPHHLRRYRLLQLSILLGVVLYAMLGYGIDEQFPIFSWALFSGIPARETTDYGLRISQIAGRELSEPIFFEEAGRYFDDVDNIAAYTLIQETGKAIAGDRADADEKRRQMELLCFGGQRVTYDLVRRSFDIFERSRQGRFQSITSLETFTANPETP